ncbi:50S ribosomal protein L18 [Candidatus Pacearchaeota archaeon]|nr:50S ribosomal protein L18 [Candidatus Pacearchaeota archaeon]
MKRIKYKRRRKNKTDYSARFILLKSKLPRIVIRKTNRYIIIQLVESKEAQDYVIQTTTSKDLVKHGWNESIAGSLKSIPAAYLTGFLLAKRLKDIKRAIIDLGLQRSTKGNRLYATIKGLIDGGVQIQCDEKMFPDVVRLHGRHMRKEIPIETIKNNILKGK